MVSLVLVAAVGAPALAAESSVELGGDVVSRYVFRGVILDDGWSFQPRLALSLGLGESTSLDVEAWWNAALETHGSPTHKDEVAEVDLTVSLSQELSDTVSVWVGGVYYDLPFSDVGSESETWSTTEVAAGLEWAPEPVTAEASLYYDIDRFQGLYLDLAAEVGLPLGRAFSVNPRLHFGFAQGFDPDPSDPDQESYYLDNGLVDGDLAVGLAWTPSEVLSFTIAGHYTHRFDGVDEDESFAWCGLGVSYTP